MSNGKEMLTAECWASSLHLCMCCPSLWRRMGRTQNPYLRDGAPHVSCKEFSVYRIQGCITPSELDKDYYWYMLIYIYYLKVRVLADRICSVLWLLVLASDGEKLSWHIEEGEYTYMKTLKKKDSSCIFFKEILCQSTVALPTPPPALHMWKILCHHIFL
jgi:hypothetical protein